MNKSALYAFVASALFLVNTHIEAVVPIDPAYPLGAHAPNDNADDETTDMARMFGGNNPDDPIGVQLAKANQPFSPAIQWTHQFGTIGPAVDTGQAVAVDSSGNSYIVGRVPGALPSQVNVGSGDVFLRKYDANGQLVWTKQFGSSGDDTALCVSVKDNSVYVSGRVGGALPGKSFFGISDAFLRKYDTSGNLLWTDEFGTNDIDEIFMIAVDNSLSPTAVYVTGRTFATLPGQTSAGGADIFVRKYDDNGSSFTVVKTVQFGGRTATGGTVNSNDTGTTITIDTSLVPTAIYVAGIVNADIDGAGPETFKGGADGFVQRRDPNLNIIWTRQLGASVGDFVDSGATAPGSGIYLVGRTNSTFGGPVIGNFDAIVLKYDPNGNQVWLRKFGSVGFDEALSVAADSTLVYVAGFTGGNLFGTSAGGNDGFLSVFDTNGNTLLSKQNGSLGSDQFLGVALDGTMIYVAGSAEGALSGIGTDNPENVGDSDAILRKYDANLNDIWTNRFGTIGPIAEVANAIARAPDGYVYVAGSTRGPLVNTLGLNDAYLRKYDRAGNEIWTRQFGTPVNDSGAAVAADARGRICIAGATEGALAGTYGGGATDGFVRCYDKAGNKLWSAQIGTNLQDDATSITIDLQGNVIVGGRADGILPNQGTLGATNVYVRKFDPNGNELWTREFVGGGADGVTVLFTLTADNKGNVLVGGRTFRTLTGEPIGGTFDGYVRKLDPDGNVLWTHQIRSNGSDQVNAISTSPNDDGAVFAGGFAGALLLDETHYAGGNDAFIRKYDAEGNVIWTDFFGTSGNDAVNAVSANAIGDVYIGGLVAGILPGQTSAGTSDAFARKYDKNGNEIWTLQLGSGIGSPLTDTITGISGHESGDVYVSGITAGALVGQTSAGDNDAFVMKIIREK